MSLDQPYTLPLNYYEILKVSYLKPYPVHQGPKRPGFDTIYINEHNFRMLWDMGVE